MALSTRRAWWMCSALSRKSRALIGTDVEPARLAASRYQPAPSHSKAQPGRGRAAEAQGGRLTSPARPDRAAGEGPFDRSRKDAGQEQRQIAEAAPHRGAVRLRQRAEEHGQPAEVQVVPAPAARPLRRPRHDDTAGRPGERGQQLGEDTAGDAGRATYSASCGPSKTGTRSRADVRSGAYPVTRRSAAIRWTAAAKTRNGEISAKLVPTSGPTRLSRRAETAGRSRTSTRRPG